MNKLKKVFAFSVLYGLASLAISAMFYSDSANSGEPYLPVFVLSCALVGITTLSAAIIIWGIEALYE